MLWLLINFFFWAHSFFMTRIKTKPLHDHFGADVLDIDLATVTADHLFPEIRGLFETHSMVLFRNQQFDGDVHMRLAQLFGPLENREAMAGDRDIPFEIPKVSNERDDGSLLGENDMRLLDLQANMLWHTDSTFLPVPALANLLTARVVPSSGGATEFASTRRGWADMPVRLRQHFEHASLWHRLSHSRARINPDLAAMNKMTRWPDRCWKALWRNPVTKEDALYIASHAFSIDGHDSPDQGASLIDEAIAFMTTPDRVYTHQWQVGDVLIWDERAVLHRGTPWPYDEPRTLESICVSVTAADGLDVMYG